MQKTLPADEVSALAIARHRRYVSRGRAALAQVLGSGVEIRSHGATVWAADGREFLNCGGYGTFLHGATHPQVVRAVVEQARKHPLSTRLLLDPLASEAAEALLRISPPGMERVHFVLSGADATETAIKIARTLGKHHLVTTHGGFHGKSMGALSLTARDMYQAPFRPLLPDVTTIPFGDARALERTLEEHPGTSCLFVEPVQGENGVRLPPDGYLAEAASLCRSHGALLVLDEVLTGLGRTGRWWGADRDRVTPDVMLVAKGLSGGVVPVGAVVCRQEVYEAFDKDPYLHTSTFAASPLAMAAAKAAIEVAEHESFPERSARLGPMIQLALTEACRSRCPHLVVEVRGEGLLWGIEFVSPDVTADAVLELLHRGVLVNHSFNSSETLRLTPPALLTDDELAQLLRAWEESLDALTERYPARG
ncbi:aspartate aminotransferase family protein [Streptomyces sp. NPDC059917]|uniref:aspartate aminotransferase family protein n=1 Tax=Streptomyces sp. NPDC059917 TaxID=3347002 RepID=UPI00364D36EA